MIAFRTSEEQFDKQDKENVIYKNLDKTMQS